MTFVPGWGQVLGSRGWSVSHRADSAWLHRGYSSRIWRISQPDRERERPSVYTQHATRYVSYLRYVGHVLDSDIKPYLLREQGCYYVFGYLKDCVVALHRKFIAKLPNICLSQIWPAEKSTYRSVRLQVGCPIWLWPAKEFHDLTRTGRIKWN